MKQINKKNDCDYLDLSVNNSYDMLNDCIGNGFVDKMSESILDKTHTVDNPSIGDIIEPFGNIDRVNCPSRVPGELECPDGYTNIDGVCKQVCVHCDYNDATGYFGNCTDNNGVYKNNRSPEYMDYVNEDFMYISSFN
tara:strand:+ start:52 stop:465 length:414 start_codon:yes stop_codon:yes gene_type:complete